VKTAKIVLIGAGSASFGVNTVATLLREPSLQGSTIALVDLNAEGLALVHRLCERVNREWKAGATLVSDTDRCAVLADADFVVSAIEVGPREELWRQDWEIPLRHGLRQPYAENGGPGGMFHAARNIPHILDIARDMERLCPDALLVNLTNPVRDVLAPASGMARGRGLAARAVAALGRVAPPSFPAPPGDPMRAWWPALRTVNLDRVPIQRRNRVHSS
jgi:alpha-galactosidase/6-phospho-beta-glucosidase family protein